MDETAARKLLGFNVGELRSRVGMTQDQLAEALGVHLRHMKAVEAGTRAPSFSLMVRIAEAVEAELHELLLPAKVRPRPRGRPKRS